nr:MAG TPA: Putative ATP dependent Clp protease [Caudoviricetes sp.]
MSEPKQTPKRMWDLKQRADAADTLDLYIYGDVAGDSQDWWTGEVIQSETSANALRDALAEYPDAKEIAIYINSYGGSVFEGTAIYNQLKRHSAHKTVYVDGFACSIASVIAMAGDTVVMPRNALMMIHNMSMGVYGTAAELRQAAENLDTINQAGMAAYLEKAGDKLEPEKLKEMYDAETWLTAEQCMTLGLADQYAEADADMSKAAEILQKANLTMEQRINVQKSLAAQLRQLTTAPAAPPLPHDPPAPQEPKQKNRIMSLFG